MATQTAGKLLCLHGYTQSGATLHKKTSALRTTLRKSLALTFSFPTAPHRVQPFTENADDRESSAATLQADLGDEEGHWAWWTHDEEAKTYKGLDQGMDFLAKVLEEEGPFVGVMGFSQGAAMAAMLSSALERSLLKSSHPPLKFAIIYSGFRAGYPQYDNYYDPKIKTPTLHVIGQMDSIVVPERCQKLVEVCEGAEVMEHPGGHFVPSAAPYRKGVVEFIERCLKKGSEGERATL
ncbi:FSH1-domain-containing protein [Saitoella complicata NRRL Y-17804]|uniref:Serine hydrolase domain-containing protein n=1 Tax=Saitoella complicata (strain BCRC 22490 / CBS 7301 / JCM 7358 / NBRC 10748 / NRRL Y-17804) TaxID=698492 RepID=A0A0E9NDF1_SAICN|nr:FSH1-domain-containing protein [Saitoella complicata NRRL Y-17804]ODQ56175.1 FSH1-domain-containing protein [Saitoella complicata NRRL Y-17804]GAO47859.1 hypothetical protein G7K_2055-t1 [Saitoella complicata NRRL Y-17804]